MGAGATACAKLVGRAFFTWTFAREVERFSLMAMGAGATACAKLVGRAFFTWTTVGALFRAPSWLSPPFSGFCRAVLSTGEVLPVSVADLASEESGEVEHLTRGSSQSSSRLAEGADT